MLSLILRYKSFFPRLLSVNWVPWGPILFDMNSLSLLLLAVNMRFMFFESFLRLVMWSDIKRFTVLISSSSFRYCPSPGIIRETQTLASERSSNQLIICLKSVVIALVVFPIQRSLCPACKKTNSLLVSLILWRIVLISFLTFDSKGILWHLTSYLWENLDISKSSWKSSWIRRHLFLEWEGILILLSVSPPWLPETI